MNFQMSGRKPDSVMWEHFSKPVDENGVEDFRKAKCHHCPAKNNRSTMSGEKLDQLLFLR